MRQGPLREVSSLEALFDNPSRYLMPFFPEKKCVSAGAADGEPLANDATNSDIGDLVMHHVRV